MGGTKFRFPEICRTWFVSMNSFFFPLLFFFVHLRDHPHTHTHTGVRVYICEPNRRISRYKITRPQGYPELIEQERGKTFGSCGYRKEIKTVVSGLPPPFLLCMQPLHLSAHHALRIARISGSFFSSFSLSLSLSLDKLAVCSGKISLFECNVIRIPFFSPARRETSVLVSSIVHRPSLWPRPPNEI